MLYWLFYLAFIILLRFKFDFTRNIFNQDMHKIEIYISIRSIDLLTYTQRRTYI